MLIQISFNYLLKIVLLSLTDRYAIETMQSVCLKEAGVNTSSSLEEETTLIGLTFGGYLRSKVRDDLQGIMVMYFTEPSVIPIC